MEAGNVNTFLENITFQEEAVLFKGRKYFFNPYGVEDRFILDVQLWTRDDQWEEDVFHVESMNSQSALAEFLAAPIWDGRTFWEAESEMTWIDW